MSLRLSFFRRVAIAKLMHLNAVGRPSGETWRVARLVQVEFPFGSGAIISHNDAAFEKNVLIWFGPPNLTGKWQPVDAGCGSLLKCKFRDTMDQWLSKKKHDEEYYDTGMTAQRRRVMTLQWLAAAWKTCSNDGYERARTSWWRRTGCGMTADGTGDDMVKIQGHREYTLPTPPTP